jgi:hypothetical protein
VLVGSGRGEIDGSVRVKLLGGVGAGEVSDRGRGGRGRGRPRTSTGAAATGIGDTRGMPTGKVAGCIITTVPVTYITVSD